MTVICGNFFNGSGMIEGHFDTGDGKFRHGLEGRKEYTCIPAPMNSHTHLGDSFIVDEPVGTLMDIVGPGGFKHRNLSAVSVEKQVSSMRKAVEYINSTGSSGVIDFREAGSAGIRSIDVIRDGLANGLVMARPENLDDLERIARSITGIGFSAVSDMSMDYAIPLCDYAHRNGLIVASHFSENRKESLEKVSDLSPDFLVHCTALDRNDLEDLRDVTEYVAVTPRSNRFFGIDADYRKFLDAGLGLMLGTDNAMTCSPDMFVEMEFLYRIQRNRNYMSPDEVIAMACTTPYRMLSNLHTGYREKWLCFRDPEMTSYSIIRSSGRIPFIQLEAHLRF